VLHVDRMLGKILIEGVSMIKRHTRPNPGKQIKGGIAERESPIAISNVMMVTSGGVATRVGFRMEGTGTVTRRVRIAKKGGEILDKKA
jgi:large subunit ribosomal protein L24